MLWLSLRTLLICSQNIFKYHLPVPAILYQFCPSHLVTSLSHSAASLPQPSCGQYIKAILLLFCASHPMASLSQPSCCFWSWPSCGLRVSAILWLFVSPILWPVCPGHPVACFLQPSYGFLSWPSCGLPVPAIIWPVCPSYLVASILKPSCGLSVPAILWPAVTCCGCSHGFSSCGFQSMWGFSAETRGFSVASPCEPNVLLQPQPKPQLQPQPWQSDWCGCNNNVRAHTGLYHHLCL